LEKKIKQAAAEGEPAWKNCGLETGIEIWRIHAFKVEAVPKANYGQFFEGDSYIILKSVKLANGQFQRDIFFWLGKFTTQDEAGTAAYKTVELDDHFKGAASQHREVQGCESETFLGLFSDKGGLRLLQGGYDTGFKHVAPESYKPRLLHVRGTIKHIRVSEVPLTADSLNSGDTFILDAGLRIFHWNGSKSSVVERNKAAAVVRGINEERHNKVVHTVHEEGDKDLAEFWQLLGGQKPIAAEQKVPEPKHKKELYKLSDASGKLEFTEIGKGKLARHLLDSNDVFIVDSGYQVFVWVGSKTSPQERRTALQYGFDYVTAHFSDHNVPVSKVFEGGETELLNSVFDLK